MTTESIPAPGTQASADDARTFVHGGVPIQLQQSHDLQDNRTAEHSSISNNTGPQSASVSVPAIDGDRFGHVWATAKDALGNRIGSPSEITSKSRITLDGVEGTVKAFVNAGLLSIDPNSPTGYVARPQGFQAAPKAPENSVGFSQTMNQVMGVVDQALANSGTRLSRTDVFASLMASKGAAKDVRAALVRGGMTEAQVSKSIGLAQVELNRAEAAALASVGMSQIDLVGAIGNSGRKNELTGARLRLASGDADAMIKLAKSLQASRPSLTQKVSLDPNKYPQKVVKGVEVVDLRAVGLPEMSKTTFIRMARDGSLDKLMARRHGR